MRTSTIILLATAMLALAACETMDGLGKDTQKLGNNISDKADKNK